MNETKGVFVQSQFKINDEKERKMKLGRILAAASVAVVVASSVALAGPTGQINIPSTDAKALKEVTISINNYARFSSAADAGANSYGVGVVTGLLPFEKVKLEVGADYTTSGTGTSYPFSFNAKLATAEDALFTGLPAFAVGTYNLGTISAALPQNIVYGLVAKTLPVVGRISAGGYSGAERALGKKVNNGVLVSWDRTISEISDKLWLGIDYMSGKNADGEISFGGSWSFTKQVTLLAGITIPNPGQSTLPGGKPTFTTQLSINLP
jgi:hypothetical protein